MQDTGKQPVIRQDQQAKHQSRKYIGNDPRDEEQGDIQPGQAQFAIQQDSNKKAEDQGQARIANQKDDGVSDAFTEQPHAKKTLEIIEANKGPARRLSLLQAQPDRVQGGIDLYGEQYEDRRQDQPKGQRISKPVSTGQPGHCLLHRNNQPLKNCEYNRQGDKLRFTLSPCHRVE